MNHALQSVCRFRLLGISLLAFGLLPVSMNASSVCQTGSLADYVALNRQGGCTIGDLSFFRFSAPTPTSSGNPVLADTSQITVTPTVTSQGLGFTFTATQNGTNYFSLPNSTTAQSATYYINYTIDPAPVEVGETLTLDPPFGNVTATSNVCLFDVLSNDCALGIPTGLSVSTASPSASVLYPVPAFFIDVQNTINMQATPGNPAGFDGLVELYEISASTAVPEPMNVLLTGIGLCGLLGLASVTRCFGSRLTRVN
jgi:hypothetical protein